MSTQAKTNAQPISLGTQPQLAAPRSQLGRARRRFLRHRLAVLGGVILVALVLFVTLGTLVYSESEANYNDPALKLEAPSEQFPLGSDHLGRDVLARLIYGGQISLIIGLLSVTVSVILGTLVGLLAGYYGGIIDSLLMRFVEALLSIPTLLLLLVMARYFSGSVRPVEFLGRSFSGSVVVIIFIIGITSWTSLSRIVRSNVLSLRESEFVTAARALGASNRRIIMTHILPNTVAPVIVATTLGVAGAILQEAYISFLGLGVQQPTATWGNMLENARSHIADAPWLWVFPGLMIVLTVMSINFLGDGLRDALDPRSDNKV
ncbi:MAG: ABC transporter permease [bacterium]|nr:ABC transporter permease [bacterium]